MCTIICIAGDVLEASEVSRSQALSSPNMDIRRKCLDVALSLVSTALGRPSPRLQIRPRSGSSPCSSLHLWGICHSMGCRVIVVASQVA